MISFYSIALGVVGFPSFLYLSKLIDDSRSSFTRSFNKLGKHETTSVFTIVFVFFDVFIDQIVIEDRQWGS